MRLLLLCFTLLVSGCTTFAPVGTLFELGEAAQSQAEVKNHPTTIETVVTRNDDGQVVVESSSQKSIVQQPIPQPSFNTEKAIAGVPTWLVVFNVILGIFVLINTWRNRRKDDTIS